MVSISLTCRHYFFRIILLDNVLNSPNPELVYDLAKSLGHLTWGVHFGSWMPSERLQNLQPNHHRFSMHTKTNPIVFISHIIAARHDR